MEDLTHSDLVDAARRWLISRRNCRWVICEKPSYCSRESPDALGFTPIHTFLVECKMSRSDFQADRKKISRRAPDLGVGEHRYYLAPQGFLGEADLPDGWGLLEMPDRWRRRLPREKVVARPFAERARHIEQAMLISELVVIRMLLQGRPFVHSHRLEALARHLGLDVAIVNGALQATGSLRQNPRTPSRPAAGARDARQGELFEGVESPVDPQGNLPEDPEDLDITEGGQEGNIRRGKLVRAAQRGDERAREVLREEYNICCP